MAAAQYYEQIESAYLAYYGRPADPEGLVFWATQLSNANGDMTAIINAFGTSPESVALYGNTPGAAQISAIYEQLFNRAPDSAGLNFYQSGLATGQFTLASIALDIYNGATGTDATALAAKLQYADAFTSALQQDAQGNIAYSGEAAAQNARAAVHAVTDSATEQAAAANLQTTIANIANGATGTVYSLTTHVEQLAASNPGATFNANLSNNSNTFLSGDSLTATGTGNVLNVDLGNSANFAILATTNGIQTVNVTAEAQGTGGAATNNVAQLPVEINALRMAGVTHWTDVQSRADVVLENIQLPTGNANGITQDVTFTMRDTQPGSVNGSGGGANAGSIGPSFRAYFDPQALKKAGSVSTTTVKIEAGDSTAGVTAAEFAAAPEHNLPYTGFNILRDGKLISLNFSAQDVANLQGKTVTINGTTASPAAGVSAGTQADLTIAIKDALAAYNTANGTNIQVSETANDYAYTSADGIPRTTSSYTLSEAGHVLTVPTTNGWVAANGLPAVTASTANMVPGNTSTTTPLITSNLVLDNVGQGGYPQETAYSGTTEGAGGDVIIGSMATSGGVQQFNVDVQRTSWINSLQTTNNVLQVVGIVSDPSASPTTGGQGLAIGSEIAQSSNNMVDWTAPGAFVGTNGLRDVQIINATGFNGSLEIGETIDYQAFAKYLAGATTPVNFSISLGNQSNGMVNPAGVTAVVPGANAPFNSVNLAIDSAVVASGNFRETITGGNGNDFVHLVVNGQGTSTMAGNGAWVDSTTDLKNVAINVGQGNNTVIFNGAGAATISGGKGNDAYYIDNTGGTAASGQNAGMKAVWVGNAGTVAGTLGNTVSLDSYGNLTTNAAAQTSAASHTFTGSGERVTITFEGYSVNATITAATPNAAATYTSTDINNAIASAVNNDPTMSKLLHITQGSSGQSLIISSLVDGIKAAPTVTFDHPGSVGTATSSVADLQALSGYGNVVTAQGDGSSTGTGLLTGADSSLINNSSVTDTGGTNVIALSSNHGAVNTASANTVNLSGTGNSIISNYKVGTDVIKTVATHGVILNAVDDAFQLTYVGTNAANNGGTLTVRAANPHLATAASVYEGASFATATHVSGATSGAGIVVIEDTTANTTKVYYSNDVTHLASNATLEATLVGITPAAAHIHLA